MDHIFVHFMELPVTIAGFVTKNPDDTYSIILNACLSYEAQRSAYLHEMEHIKNGDYNHCINVDQIEMLRHL